VDKKTVDLAEQVGLFLLPTIRTAVKTIVGEALSGVTTKMVELAQQVERVSAEATRQNTQASQAISHVDAALKELGDALAVQFTEANTVTAGLRSIVEENAAKASKALDDLHGVVQVHVKALASKHDTLADTVKELREASTALNVDVRAMAAGMPDIVAQCKAHADEAVLALAGNVDKEFTSINTNLVDSIKAIDTLGKKVDSIPAPPAADEVARHVLAVVEPKLVESADAMRAELRIAAAGEVEKAVAALPAPKDGRDGKDGADGKEGPAGPQGAPGMLSAFEPYLEGEVYERLALVVHAGGAWQATRRTKTPPSPVSPDWQAVAAGVAGVEARVADDLRTVEVSARLSDGTVARSVAEIPALVYRGVYSATERYKVGDMVTHAGSMWVLRQPDEADIGRALDVPGKHSAWQLAVKRGQDGRNGKDGADGVQFQAGYAGEYEENKVYSKNMLVEYAGSLWLAKRPTKERPPYMVGDSNEHWLRVR
jgi:hypothetical protein